MARILQPPKLHFKCNHCGTLAEGDEQEFKLLNTMPPTWDIECPYCHMIVNCSPTPLISKLVGTSRFV